MSAKIPMQPIVCKKYDQPRFRQNSIVRYMLDEGIFDLNQLARLPGISRAERVQFAQLIGYSVAGFVELDYVTDAEAERALTIAERVRK